MATTNLTPAQLTIYLETTIRKELFRSDSFADFIAWMQSQDRAAQDFRATVERYGLREQAGNIVRRYRGYYENNPAAFERDKKNIPV